MTAPHHGRPAHLALAEVALAGVTAAVLYSFVRLFDDASFLATLVPVAVYAHAVTILLRRTGVGLAAAALVSTIGYVLLATWLWFPQTAIALVPTPATVDSLRASLDSSWTSFRVLTAPVPVETGFLVVAGTVTFLAVFLADWAAFRLWSPLEAVVPALALYLFGVLLGAEGQQIGTAIAFAAAVGLFLLASRVTRLETRSGWLAPENRQGARWLLRVGLPAVVVAVALGTLVGPVLPGTGDAALVDWRNRDENSNRIVVSPLVEIRNRLVQQSSLEAFTAESDQPAYWRLTSLDTFDGAIWRSSGRYSEADGSLDAAEPAAVGSDEIEQTFTISHLGATWLPAAYQPVAIDAQGTKVRYQSSSSTLIVDNDIQSSDDLTYRVVSRLPRPTAALLDRPDVSVPDSLEHQLQLPAAFSDDVRALAEEVVATAGADTMYERALALQAFFRDQGPFADDDHEFRYVLGSAAVGHSDDAMVDFLASGQGYCEQFAGTYAAMARSLGLPTRVAVGFSWGDPDPENPNRYIVRGRHAHAWPEVWLGEDVGWVPFEPTPGRGSPTMGDYAGVTPSQASAEGGPAATETLAPGLHPGAPTDAGDAPGEPDPTEAGEDGSGELVTATDAPEAPGGGWPAALTVVGVVLLGVAALYAGLVPALVAAVRRRRRSQAGGDPGALVRLAWRDTEEDMALLGVVRSPSETYDEFASRAATALPGPVRSFQTLASAATEAAYGAVAADPSLVSQAEGASGEIRTEVRATTTWSHRVRARLDPRRAWASLRRS